MRPTPLTFGLLIAVHMASSSSSARADGAVMIAGKISPRERDIIVDSLALTATSMTWKLSAPPFSRGAIDASLACLKDPSPWACVAPGLRGNDQLVIVQVDSDRGIGAPTTVVTAHVLTAGTDGELLASRYCEVDNEDALRRAVADLSKQLLQEAAERTGRTKLAIHSKPDKAWILLDGKTVGATNTTRVTYPGTHTIMLRQVGYKTSVREIVAIDGKTLDLAFDMEPDPSSTRRSDSHDPAPDHPPRLIPYLALGAGGAAILAGALLIAFDEDPDPRGPQRPYYYDTAKHGVASLAIGAAVAGAGVYLLLRPKPRSAATLTPLPGGGAAASWTGRF
jgi:hypothetical protein